MIILIGGASHTGKTVLAQRLLEKYHYGFYEKLGMQKPDDVVVLNKVEWTDFTVE